MQEGLLREHLSWQYDGLADEHIDLLIFVALALRLEEVNREMATTQRQSDTKNHTELRPRLERLELYRLQALTLLGRLSARVKDIAASEVELGS